MSEPRFGPDGFRADQPPFPALSYSFYGQAAAEARRASHLYWQRYRVKKSKPEAPAEPQDHMNGEEHSDVQRERADR